MAVDNKSAFIGQAILGATPSAPLFSDANNQLVSGENITTYYSAATTITVATNAAFADMTGLVTPALTGTFQVWCRTTVTHTTNNADVFMSVGIASTEQASSRAQARPFIQGGVTPSLPVPMILETFHEVTVTAQTISAMWRTTAGTASSVNSRAMLIKRIR